MDTKKLRQKILDLAIRGKLVPQDPNDEPASVLLERIRAEKERLIAEGKIKRPKKSKTSSLESNYQNLPQGWVSVNLNDIAWFGGGKTPSTNNNQFWENGSINWITSKDMKEPVIYKSKVQLSIVGACQNTLYSAGTLLMVTRSGILRRTLPLAIIGQESTINQDIKAICTPYSEITEYLYWYFTALKSEILEKYQKDGTTVESIDFEKFQQIKIMLPPFNEQKRIIGQLKLLFHLIELITVSSDEIITTIEKTKSKILELAMQGKLVSQDPADESAAKMLKRINPKAKIITDNPHYTKLNYPDSWCLVSIEDINSYKSEPLNPSNTPDRTFEVYSVPTFSTGHPEYLTGQEIGSTKQSVKKDDILLCKINPHLNRVWEVKKYSDLPQIASSEWIVIRATCLHTTFLKLYFESPEFRKLLCSQVSGVGGSLTRAQPAIVKKYIVPFPPINEQKRIVERVYLLFEFLDSIANSVN